MAQETQTGALYQPRGLGWEGDGKEVQEGEGICIPMADMDFLGGSDGNASTYNAGDPGSTPGLGRSPGDPVFLHGKSHGWRGLVDYNPWGHKDSDMTEQLHFHFLSWLTHVEV